VGTTREDGGDYSRLAGADIRLVHSRMYFVELQAAQSWTDSAGTAQAGPILAATWDRTGRAFGFNYSVKAIAPGFRARAGFVNRVGVVNSHVFNRFTVYGRRGAFVEQASTYVNGSRTFAWDDFALDRALEGDESISTNATLRGGWSLGANVSRSFYHFDPGLYSGYQVLIDEWRMTMADFTVPHGLDNLLSGGLSASTPVFRTFSASLSASASGAAIFPEAARGRQRRVSVALNWRPAAQVRVAAQYLRNTIDRSRDGSRFSAEDIPRLKVEYQASRAIFFRFVGQYAARQRDALMDAAARPIAVGGTLADETASNDFRVDWLFSYRPSPGTLIYLGYGSSLTEPDAFAFGSDLRRTTDGFFLKVSYVLRT
jgi:hypothetical protein